MTNQILTQSQLKQKFHYNPETGIFNKIINWKKNPILINIGFKNYSGYLVVKINNRPYKVHRLIWLYMTGSLPEFEIDHINRIKDDNRWCNLRQVTHQENCTNRKIRSDNKSGFKGVCMKNGKWVAKVNKIYIGRYETPEEASAAYEAFAKEHHGEFYYKRETA